MKVVSFSLFGSNPLYCVGAIRNSELMSEIFPEWEMWVYHDDTVEKGVLQKLQNNNVKLIKSQDCIFLKLQWLSAHQKLPQCPFGSLQNCFLLYN